MINYRKKRFARRLDGPRLYKPSGKSIGKIKTVNIELDEFEAVRLVDFEGFSQIEASESMQISRATLQRMLAKGRKKLVGAILMNDIIEIKNEIGNIKLKGENMMNIENKEIKVIAMPTSDGVTVDAHFGHTKEFVLFTVRNNEIVNKTVVVPPKHEPGVLPQFLAENGTNVIITGGMGKMAVDLFKQNNIDVILGANGPIELNINEYIGGFLTSTGTMCDHDHETHHNGGQH
ncbi:MAG: NifB/NifX family molybdenum-iron cluster-binding protein [Candidatus Izemoplasma sp.]